ncbi:MAG: O-antigen ligase family protein, partial [bacterium]
TIALGILNVRSKLRTYLYIFALPFFIAVIASGRRTFYAVIGNCIIVTFLLLDKSIQRRILQAGWKIGLVFVLYLAIFWNSNSDLAGPAQSIKMSFGDDQEESGGRYLSNMYRKVEDHNLATSYRAQTIIGSGYGTKLTFYMPLPLSWDMGFYSPHNQILGVFVKTGFVGFVFFIFFYLSGISEISGAFADEKELFRKAVLTFAAAAIMNHLVYSFFDIMLTGYRNNLQVGILLGLASSILTLQQSATPAVKDQSVPVATPMRGLLAARKKEDPSRPVYS